MVLRRRDEVVARSNRVKKVALHTTVRLLPCSSNSVADFEHRYIVRRSDFTAFLARAFCEPGLFDHQASREEWPV